MSNIKTPPEVRYADELEFLAEQPGERPVNWLLSPKAVLDFVLGNEQLNIQQKFFAPRRIIRNCIATLTTDRGNLFLTGVPGTGKTYLSELLAAAISKDSTLVVQGGQHIDEESLRYKWQINKLFKDGYSDEALLPSPILTAMREGKIVRIEEMTRIASAILDVTLSIFSDKNLEIQADRNYLEWAQRGFGVIATANSRDKGVESLSHAMKRRFGAVPLVTPPKLQDELDIVLYRVKAIGHSMNIPTPLPPEEEIARVLKIFRSLRHGREDDTGRGAPTIKGATLSTAEVIDAVTHLWSDSSWFEASNTWGAAQATQTIRGMVVENDQDAASFDTYMKTFNWKGKK